MSILRVCFFDLQGSAGRSGGWRGRDRLRAYGPSLCREFARCRMICQVVGRVYLFWESRISGLVLAHNVRKTTPPNNEMLIYSSTKANPHFIRLATRIARRTESAMCRSRGCRPPLALARYW